MKKSSIRNHLRPYSMYNKRRTTVNHMFASALAPYDEYSDVIIDEALRFLGQNPESDLLCVYCEELAHTWDHLVGLVADGELRGLGHQIGNLVPCCKQCNSSKGSKDWRDFIIAFIVDSEKRLLLQTKLEQYQVLFARPIHIGEIKSQLPREWERYVALRQQILELMQEADIIAEKLRKVITSTSAKDG